MQKREMERWQPLFSVYAEYLNTIGSDPELGLTGMTALVIIMHNETFVF